MSEYTATVIEPTGSATPDRPDVVGFYAMPIVSDVRNTGDRIQTMVDELGIPFVMADLFAQKKRTVFGYEAKDANKVSGDIYREMSLRRLDFVHGELSRFGGRTLLAVGDSLGVPAVQGMQLHAEPERRFDAVLARDGWNLKGQTGTTRGIGRYFGYLIQDKSHELLSGSDRGEVREYGFKEHPVEEDETSLKEKLINVADAMRGPENRTNAIILAGQAAAEHGAVLNLVGFANGISGSPEQVTAFMREARTAYNNTLREQPAHVRAQNKLATAMVDGWHSDLLDPIRGAADVRATLDLIPR
jgi:hypothetical protein